ncbi:MAG: hypothetical protein LUE08_04070 [Akkermansiaceae bacterium]|nr:hypothetical protein [Akkermansiaceae bacterium]
MGVETLAWASLITSVVGSAAGTVSQQYAANKQSKAQKSLALEQERAAQANVTVTSQGDAPQADASANDQASEEAAARKAKRRASLSKTTNPGVLGGLSTGKRTLGG